MCIAQSGVAQFKVATNGNAGIQLGTQTPLSPLSINTAGDINNKLSIAGTFTGLSVSRNGDYSGQWTFAINAQSEVNNGNFNLGVYSIVQSSTLQTYGRAYGVLGAAGNATSGYNYGVLGALIGQGQGAGIVGTVGTVSLSVPGTYAGYFLGNVAVS